MLCLNRFVKSFQLAVRPPRMIFCFSAFPFVGRRRLVPGDGFEALRQ